VLPHLDESMLQEVFPPVSVPGPRNDRDLVDDELDVVWKRGIAIGEDLMRYAAKAGRKRFENEGGTTTPIDK